MKSAQSKIEYKEQICGRMRVFKRPMGKWKLTFMDFRLTQRKKDIEK